MEVRIETRTDHQTLSVLVTPPFDGGGGEDLTRALTECSRCFAPPYYRCRDKDGNHVNHVDREDKARQVLWAITCEAMARVTRKHE